MATVILVRHGRTTSNATGILAGRSPGIELDEVGREQAAATARRLAPVPLVAAVSSPLDRCLQTTRAILDLQGEGQTLDLDGRASSLEGQTSAPALELQIDEGIIECGYGDWTGRPLRELAEEPLWKTVQVHPSAVVFPGGESMASMQARAVDAIRRRDAEIEREHGPGAVWLAVSHGDIIKSILADALGMHLDLFQRISVGPASVSIVRYGTARPEVIATNTEAGDLSWLRTEAAPDPAGAPVGGGAGHHPPSPTP
ncbi:histidine phosphatase family protein [Herbiconiux sp. P15]|uniref:histidine phosphatase family protein n=1 Tax=Herbiconiux liukaitaii TaxID=3342799 RepID=UPI0035B93592